MSHLTCQHGRRAYFVLDYLRSVPLRWFHRSDGTRCRLGYGAGITEDQWKGIVDAVPSVVVPSVTE